MRRGSGTRQSKGNADLSQFGIFALPEGPDALDMEDDGSLEAELMSILGDSNAGNRRAQDRKVAKPNPGANLDQMIAESLRDVPSGDESSGDEDDPSLLEELQLYTGEKSSEVAAPPPSSSHPPKDLIILLNERLNMYKLAESAAKSSGDNAKARRLNRGLKTLEVLLKKAREGGVVDESEIPLPVSVSASKPPPSVTEIKEEVPAPPVRLVEPSLPPISPTKIEDPPPPPIPPRRSISKSSIEASSSPVVPEVPKVNEDLLNKLLERQNEFKRAAVAAKKSGDLETARNHVRTIKQFDNVITSVKEGNSVNLDTMPASPMIPTIQVPSTPASVEVQPPAPPITQPSSSQTEGENQSENDNTIPQPATILEALEQRLAVFQKQAENAKTEGNSSKARRMGRIVKQYEDSIKLHKTGKEIPVDELPTPPGFPPIPVDKKPAPAATPPSESIQPPPRSPSQVVPPSASSLVPPLSPSQPAPQPDASRGSPSLSPIQRAPSPTPSSASTSSVVSNTSGRVTRQERQLAVLLQRQKEWKDAAIMAKRSGDLTKAKDCLRQAKGFDSLIEASRSGLPVDLTTIPLPPKDRVENDFEVITERDCLPGTNSDIYEQLKHDLTHQFKMSMETRLHYKALGDVANANKFEQLAVHTKKDLDRVMVLHERNDPVPRYHYEMKTFSIVRSNTDLTDNDLELTIIQGINYNVPNPKEIDTYVRYEFPFPTDDPRRDKTSTVYNTNNPQYNAKFIIPIIRTNRPCMRVFKRHSLKLEIWSKGGFLRSDSLVGTASVKLLPLETKCTIHDSFNLMDGRKPVGGKLEVKLRLRHPIHEKEIDQVKEKWLLID